MPKRKAELDSTNADEKRTKRAEDPLADQKVHLIHSAKDLRFLLAFEQDAGSQTRRRVQVFKSFLHSIIYANESDDRAAKQALLLDYLQSETPKEGHDTSLPLADLLQTWHFAVQANVESLFSSVVAVLALLLRTISGLIEFRACGNYLCGVLLQEDQIQLFDKAFSVNKSKEYLISPCLRLLTEIVLFDGGHSARNVFRQRKITFKRLETFLSMRSDSHAGHLGKPKTLSVRDNALRYLYAHLRLQSPTAKMEILAHRQVVRALLEDLNSDSPELVSELLEVLENHVASDGAISPSSKARFFSIWVLVRLTALYGYTKTGNFREPYHQIQLSAHRLLLLVCTRPGNGVLGVQGGVERSLTSRIWPTSSSRLDVVELRHRYERVGTFLQTLRPHAHTLQKNLILAVFRQWPEMISDYFARRKSFSFDPKLTVTWIGYSSFMLATVQLPLPNLQVPEVTSEAKSCESGILLETILPQPLSQKVLTRCLNQHSSLIKFMALRILSAAFQKLSQFLHRSSYARTDSDLAKTSLADANLASNIVDGFVKRVPDFETLLVQYRTCAAEPAVFKESIARVLALYYEILPQLALGKTFDISNALSAALTKIHSRDGLKQLEIEHMLKIATFSNMQWFHKSGDQSTSPFTVMLKICCSPLKTTSTAFRVILSSIALESHVLHSHSSLDTLIAALDLTKEQNHLDNVLAFLDDCILRLARKPVRYYDELASLRGATGSVISVGESRIDLLLVTILEQWPFLAKTRNKLTAAKVLIWLASYLELLRLNLCHTENEYANRGDDRIISLVKIRVEAGLNDEDKLLFSKAMNKTAALRNVVKTSPMTDFSDETLIMGPISVPQTVNMERSTSSPPAEPPQEPAEHIGLHRWTREDLPNAIFGGAISELILCFCSGHAEIRKQALSSMGFFVKKLESSGYSEWQQIFVLAGELMETAQEMIEEDALPYFTGALASSFLSILSNPLHFLYAKTNAFMNRTPRWDVMKLPSYWVDKILLNPPTDDEAHYQEVGWLLDALLEGLRTSKDFDTYRRCNIFERLLSLSTSPSLPEGLFGKLVDLLFRCTHVDGSTTLITRCGLMAWISSCLSSPSKMTSEGRLLRLGSMAHERCDWARVGKWSGDSLRTSVDNLDGSTCT